jgi:hypothetical protein
VAAVTVVSYGWMDKMLTLERSQKAYDLIVIAIVAVMLGLAIFGLSLRSTSAESK